MVRVEEIQTPHAAGRTRTPSRPAQRDTRRSISLSHQSEAPPSVVEQPALLQILQCPTRTSEVFPSIQREGHRPAIARDQLNNKQKAGRHNVGFQPRTKRMRLHVTATQSPSTQSPTQTPPSTTGSRMASKFSIPLEEVARPLQTQPPQYEQTSEELESPPAHPDFLGTQDSTLLPGPQAPRRNKIAAISLGKFPCSHSGQRKSRSAHRFLGPPSPTHRPDRCRQC